MNIETRQRIERQIVRQLVKDALAQGYRLAVSLERGYDVDEMLLGSTNVSEIMKAAFAGDEAHLFVQPATGNVVENGQVISNGWVYIVLGNDGYDVISDYTTNLESLLFDTSRLAERLEAKHG